MSHENQFHLTGVVRDLKDRNTAKGSLYSTFNLENKPEHGGPFSIPLATFGHNGGLLTKGRVLEGAVVEIEGQIKMRSNVSATNGKTYFNVDLSVGNINVIRQGKAENKTEVVVVPPSDNPLDSLPF